MSESTNTIDYLENIKIHNFPEDMSIMECVAETCLLAEYNWSQIIESSLNTEFEAFDHNMKIGMIKEDAAKDAEDSGNKKFKDKAIDAFKKVGSYIYGLFVKFVNAIGNIFNKGKFLISEDALKRELDGLSKLEKDDKKFSGYLFDGKDALDTIYTAFNNANSIIDGYIRNPKSASSLVNFEEHLLGNIVGEDNTRINKDDFIKLLRDTIGKENNDWTLDNDTLKKAQDNFKDNKKYTVAAKGFYEKAKLNINTSINLIKASDEDTIKESVKLCNISLKTLAKVNGIVLSALKDDYNTCMKVLYKCYKAGSKEEKEESKNESVSSLTESLESIFGSPILA